MTLIRLPEEPLCIKCGGSPYLDTWDRETEARKVKCSNPECDAETTGHHFMREFAIREWREMNER